MSTSLTPTERRELAEKLGLNEQYLWQCLAGKRDMNPTTARRLEVETAGRLRRQDLCQKTWRGIWPELTDPAKTRRARSAKAT